MPVFEPYEESLPLQSGLYSFVIDSNGHFRVKLGVTRSHAAMVENSRAAAAGRFRVNRMGRVVEVVCRSTDYNFFYASVLPPVLYVISSFRDHEALDLHPQAVFTFHKEIYETWSIGTDGLPIDDPAALMRQLLDEGLGEEITADFGVARAVAFSAFVPAVPPQLYAIHQDQLVISLEEVESPADFERGDPADRLSPGLEGLRCGKNNFVIDREGWVIVGPSGHHLLSGGADVGGAGHIYLNGGGVVARIDLNFSGHYRPHLSGDYVRYVYEAFAKHPLLTVAPNCEFSGRIFRGTEAATSLIRFFAEELASDDPELDWRIESSYV